MRRFTLALGLAACACVAVACSQKDEPAANTAPPAKSPSWDDQSDRDWLYRMQFKDHMRHMWIDSNRIASAGRGDKQPNFDEIWAGATDIGQRSAIMLGYWSAIRDSTAQALAALEDSDRIAVAERIRDAGLACDGCHMATWSPAYLHVTGKVVDAWAANQDTPMDHPEVDANPPPEIPARRTMAALWKELQEAQQALKSWDKKTLASALKAIKPPASQGATFWATVHDNALKIEAAAKARKREGMREAYNALRMACQSCHAVSAGPERPIQTPLAWD